MGRSLRRPVGHHEVIGIGAGPIGEEAREPGLRDRIVGDDLPEIALEDIEHFSGWEVHVVQVRVVGKAVAPVRPVQFLDAIELLDALEEEKLVRSNRLSWSAPRVKLVTWPWRSRRTTVPDSERS